MRVGAGVRLGARLRLGARVKAGCGQHLHRGGQRQRRESISGRSLRSLSSGGGSAASHRSAAARAAASCFARSKRPHVWPTISRDGARVEVSCRSGTHAARSAKRRPPSEHVEGVSPHCRLHLRVECTVCESVLPHAFRCKARTSGGTEKSAPRTQLFRGPCFIPPCQLLPRPRDTVAAASAGSAPPLHPRCARAGRLPGRSGGSVATLSC